VRIDGVELTLIDTAGLREGGDAIEREGMRRAQAELQRADLAIVVVDARDPEVGRKAVAAAIAGVPEILWLHNKADLLAQAEPADHPEAATSAVKGHAAVLVSAWTGVGLPELHARLRALAAGPQAEAVGGTFTARARQVDALGRAAGELDAANAALASETLDLAAESLRAAHDALGEITGRVAPDDLLGHIFSTFCIGK